MHFVRYIANKYKQNEAPNGDSGVTGQINISKGGGRQPVYQLYALNLKREQQMYAVTTCDLDSPEVRTCH